MKYYFTLQYKRLYRYIDEFGLNPIFGIFILAFLFYVLSNSFFEKIEYAKFIYSAIGLIVIGKLSNKKRNEFLKNIYNSIKFKKIRLYENLIVSMPFFFFMIYKQEFVSTSVFLIFALIISQFNKVNSNNFVIPTPFYKKPFEFIVGFRNIFWIFLLAYTITYIAVLVDNFNLGIFALMTVYVTSLSFYSKPEPIFYVWIYSLSPADFLERKIRIASLFSLILSLPIIITLLVFFSINDIGLILIFSFLGLLLLIANLLGKYSYFPSKLPLMQGIAIGLCFVFPPALLIVIPYFYSLSKRKLKNILK